MTDRIRHLCTRMGCGNPVADDPDDDHFLPLCGKHGGATRPTFVVHHAEHGWLTDTGVGGSYSMDIDDAQWFWSDSEAVDTLGATDIATPEEINNGPFAIMRIK